MLNAVAVAVAAVVNVNCECALLGRVLLRGSL